MNRRAIISLLQIIAILTFITTYACAEDYSWLDIDTTAKSYIENHFPPPHNYSRIVYDSTSYAHWLRNLPLKPAGSKVHLYNGSLKNNQNVHTAVIDIDIGDKNLQQCADAVIRLRAEYLYSQGLYDSIAFKFTSGDIASYRDWIEGYRPIVHDDRVDWRKRADTDSSYTGLRDYLTSVFTYAGSYSLKKELKPVSLPCEIKPGDIFIQGGFPGHAVIVVDVAVDSTNGRRVFLLAQSFMPAQEIHILINPNNPDLSPWYDCRIIDSLVTPEWVFKPSDLMHFP